MKTGIELGVEIMTESSEPSSWSIRGQMAYASRRDRATPIAELRAMKRDYAAAKIAEFIEAEVKKIPPLTDEQISRISRAMRALRHQARPAPPGRERTGSDSQGRRPAKNRHGDVRSKRQLIQKAS